MSKQKNFRISELTQSRIEDLRKEFSDESEADIITIAVNMLTFLMAKKSLLTNNDIQKLAFAGSRKYLALSMDALIKLQKQEKEGDDKNVQADDLQE